VLDAQVLVKLNGLGNQVSIEFVKLLREQRGKVFGDLVGLLQTTTKTVCEGRDVRNMVVFTDLRLLLHVALELGLPVLAQQPLEHRFLDLLVVLTLKVFIRKKLHRTHHKQLSST